MWDIIRFPHWIFHGDLCFEDEYNIILRMNSIRFICRLTCDYWLTRLRESGFEIGWYLVLEIGSCYEITCCISTWRVNWPAAWIGTWKWLLYIWWILGWSFTWHTVSHVDLKCIRIFGWLITVTSTWTHTWISKSWSYDAWNSVGGTSWVVVWLWSDQVLVILSPA